MTDSFFGGSNGVPPGERCRIQRAYGRVSRDKMQANLKARLSSAGVTKIRGRVDPKTVRFSAPRGRGDQFTSCSPSLLPTAACRSVRNNEDILFDLTSNN